MMKILKGFLLFIALFLVMAGIGLIINTSILFGLLSIIVGIIGTAIISVWIGKGEIEIPTETTDRKPAEKFLARNYSLLELLEYTHQKYGTSMDEKEVLEIAKKCHLGELRGADWYFSQDDLSSVMRIKMARELVSFM
jgi:hypothetical protein